MEKMRKKEREETKKETERGRRKQEIECILKKESAESRAR